MYTFRTYNATPTPNPFILLSSGEKKGTPSRKPMHSGRYALEGLIISLGGEVTLHDAPLVMHFHKKVRIKELSMTDVGLLAHAAHAPATEFLLWGLDADDADRLQEHILNSGIDIPEECILERDYLRAINKSFIREHGELDNSDFLKISKARNVMALARLMRKPVPLPGDTVRGAYYGGEHPFNAGMVDSMYYMDEGDRMTICASPSAHITPDTGTLSISGGPFFGVHAAHMTFAGTHERLFWTFGHAGMTRNGGVYFPITVNKWDLSQEADI